MKREHEALLRHELKNRITPILGYSHMLMEAAEDDKQKRWASTIYNSSEDMANLIDALKGLQDIESGTVSLSKEPLDLYPFLARIAEDLTAALEHRVKIDIEGEEPNINGDRNLLAGVFHNLVKNAAEHVAKLDDETQRAVHIRISKGLNKTIVSINNGGDPVPQDLLESFFEKFNTENKPGGTGLGTTYAALVTRAHNGDIAVTSTAEEGTTVAVTLPA